MRDRPLKLSFVGAYVSYRPMDDKQGTYTYRADRQALFRLRSDKLGYGSSLSMLDGWVIGLKQLSL